MGQKHKNLFQKIVSRENLYSAYHKAARGKRYSTSHLIFHEHLAANIAALGDSIRTGAYMPGVANTFLVHEPKTRLISAMPFVDRVAEHALCNVIEPIFEKVFLPQSYACRPGKGTHAAAGDVQAELRRRKTAGATTWVLKTDYSRYFYSIRRPGLHREYRRKIACSPTLGFIKALIPEEGCGLDIGRLTSQLSANINGHVVDRWLAHTVGIKHFYRYMDDIVVLGYSREAMDVLRLRLESFSEAKLGLKFSHWSVQPAARGINFVGYRIWDTHKLLRHDSVLRAKRKIKRYTKHGETELLAKFIASWKGHAKWADSNNLLRNLGVA